MMMAALLALVAGQTSVSHEVTSLYPIDWSYGRTFCTVATCNPRNPVWGGREVEQTCDELRPPTAIQTDAANVTVWMAAGGSHSIDASTTGTYTLQIELVSADGQSAAVENVSLLLSRTRITLRAVSLGAYRVRLTVVGEDSVSYYYEILLFQQVTPPVQDGSAHSPQPHSPQLQPRRPHPPTPASAGRNIACIARTDFSLCDSLEGYTHSDKCSPVHPSPPPPPTCGPNCECSCCLPPPAGAASALGAKICPARRFDGFRAASPTGCTSSACAVRFLDCAGPGSTADATFHPREACANTEDETATTSTNLAAIIAPTLAVFGLCLGALVGFALWVRGGERRTLIIVCELNAPSCGAVDRCGGGRGAARRSGRTSRLRGRLAPARRCRRGSEGRALQG